VARRLGAGLAAVPAAVVARLVAEARGSVKAAVHAALAAAAWPEDAERIGSGSDVAAAALADAADATEPEAAGPAAGPAGPAGYSVAALCHAESAVRRAGADGRELLRCAWPSAPAVSRCLAAWDRLGGASSRALVLDAAFTAGLSQTRGGIT
jgi:hypothetical protein